MTALRYPMACDDTTLASFIQCSVLLDLVRDTPVSHGSNIWRTSYYKAVFWTRRWWAQLPKTAPSPDTLGPLLPCQGAGTERDAVPQSDSSFHSQHKGTSLYPSALYYPGWYRKHSLFWASHTPKLIWCSPSTKPVTQGPKLATALQRASQEAVCWKNYSGGHPPAALLPPCNMMIIPLSEAHSSVHQEQAHLHQTTNLHTE